MKKINFLFVFLLLVFISSDVWGQQYIPTILVEYDNAGNRVLRKLENICYGCPKPAPPGTDRPYREPGIEHITMAQTRILMVMLYNG